MTLHPLAEYFNTPEKYQILKNLCEAHERANGNTEVNIAFSEKELQRELEKVKDKIDKSLAKVFK